MDKNADVFVKNSCFNTKSWSIVVGIGIFLCGLSSVSFAATAVAGKRNALGVVVEQSHYILTLSPTNRSESTSVKYVPNLLSTAGLQATFYDFTVEYKTSAGRNPTDDAKKGVTSYEDLRFTFNLGSENQWLLGAYYTRYGGLYIENSSDVDPAYVGADRLIQRGDFSIFNYGTSLMYVLSPERFSLAAALFQSARQTESGGSFLIMTALDGSQFSANSSIIPATQQSLFGKDADLTSAKFNTASMTVGYGYTLTTGSFFLTAMGLIGPGFQWRQYTASGLMTSSTANATKFFVAGALGYNGETLYTAVILTDSQTESATESIRFRPEFQQLRLVLGFRF